MACMSPCGTSRKQNVNQAREMAEETKTLKGKVEHFTDIDKFTDSLSSQPRKVFIFSITHGWPADFVLEKILDDLQEGDIILDGGNEHYRNTERRQRECDKKGQLTALPLDKGQTNQ